MINIIMNYIHTRVPMKRAVSLLFILLLITPLLKAYERTINIGTRDRWAVMVYEDNVHTVPGRNQYQDLVLKDGEYSPDSTTDLLLHFNDESPEDEAGNYTITKSTYTSVKKPHNVLGSGGALFRNWTGGIELEPRAGALFSPGTELIDFTIEFWLYPAQAEDEETVLVWQGKRKQNNDFIHQEIKCSFENRRLTWEFTNFFLPIDGESHSLSLEGNSFLIPGEWHHHTLRYNSQTGLLEYYKDGEPEAIQYATHNGEENTTILFPYIGELVKGSISLGSYFTGMLDELRLSRAFIEDPFHKTYTSTPGTAITRPIDFGYSNSTLKSITVTDTTPANSDINYFYYLSDSDARLSPDDPGWIPFEPGKPLPGKTRGRFLSILIRLYPDGSGKHSPAVSNISIDYQPDLPPPPPAQVTALASNNKVELNWKRVGESDVQGYLVYFGTESGMYFGEESALGPSPIDVGMQTSVTIEGLENGTLYYFSVVTYDSSSPPHKSTFSREVSVRPTQIGYDEGE
jgi:hypothetical protein